MHNHLIPTPIPSVREALTDLSFSLMNAGIPHMPEVVVHHLDDWVALRRALPDFLVFLNGKPMQIHIAGIPIRYERAVPADISGTEWDFCHASPENDGA